MYAEEVICTREPSLTFSQILAWLIEAYGDEASGVSDRPGLEGDSTLAIVAGT